MTPLGDPDPQVEKPTTKSTSTSTSSQILQYAYIDTSLLTIMYDHMSVTGVIFSAVTAL